MKKILQRIKNIWRWGEYKPSTDADYPAIVKDTPQPVKRLATIIMPEKDNDYPNK